MECIGGGEGESDEDSKEKNNSNSFAFSRMIRSLSRFVSREFA